MIKYAPYLVAVTLATVTPVYAASVQRELASLNYPNEPIGPTIWNADSFTEVLTPRPLATQGKWLDDQGVSPHLGLTQFYLANPGVGVDTGNHEALTLIDVGADFDLEKIFGWHGTRVHFNELYVPYRNHLEFGAQTGDVLSNKTGPYIPRVSHLTLFTVEQKLLDDQLTLETGISNAGSYFGLPLCNIGLGCTSLPDAAGASPTPYANWGARVNYQFTPALSSQAGVWRTNDAYPFTNGWERGPGDSGGNMANAFFANVAYRTNYATDAYPEAYELVGFHNNNVAKDPFFTTQGTSQISDPTLGAEEKKGIDGFYVGLKKTVWRADGGKTNDPMPTALSAYFAANHVLDAEVPNGVATQASTGVILSAPFKSRPYDTYSLSAHWVQLSEHKQRYIEEAYSTMGLNYAQTRNEYAVDLDANFILTHGVVISPYAMYTWGPSSLINPFSGVQPQSGVSAGFLFHIQLETFLGLDSGQRR